MPTLELNFILFVAGIATIPYGVLAGACPEIEAPPGAAMSFTGPLTEGITVTAFCTNGALMSGPSMLTCIGGQWHPEEFGSCMGGSGFTGSPSGAQCLAMLPPPGATLTYGESTTTSGLIGLHNHSTMVSMKCNDGTPVMGASNSVCTNGIWMPPVLGTCMNSGSYGILPNPNMMTPFTSEVMCHFGLIPPMNGNITYDASLPAPSGSTATLSCDFGYTAKGNTVSTCQNGMFSMLGTCERSS